MLESLGYAVAYAIVGMVILAVGFFVLDLLTPGRLSHVIWQDQSYSAALVAAAGMLGQSLIIFTAIWTNASSGFGSALGWTVAFGLVGIALQAVAFVFLDVVTPGKLGDWCTSARISPAAVVASAAQIAVSLIVVASIA